MGSYRSYVNGLGASPLVLAGQGFFVRATAGTTLALSNANRVTTFGPQPSFYRPAADSRPLVQLTLQGASSPATHEAYVYLAAGPDARFDARKLRNTGPAALHLASLAGALSINGLPSPGPASLEVPLTVAAAQPGTYTLRATQLLNQTGSVALRFDTSAGPVSKRLIRD